MAANLTQKASCREMTQGSEHLLHPPNGLSALGRGTWQPALPRLVEREPSGGSREENLMRSSSVTYSKLLGSAQFLELTHQLPMATTHTATRIGKKREIKGEEGEREGERETDSLQPNPQEQKERERKGEEQDREGGRRWGEERETPAYPPEMGKNYRNAEISFSPLRIPWLKPLMAKALGPAPSLI